MLSSANSHQDSIDHNIDDFFDNYFNTLKEERRKKFLPLLIDKKFQKKVKLSDDELQVFIDSTNNLNHPPSAYPSYFIDRVLLHALIFKPEITTILFARVFIIVAEYVRNTYSTIDGTSQSIQHHSITYRPENDFDYLLNCYNSKLNPVEFANFAYQRPAHMIILPHQIQTPLEWYEIAICLDQRLLTHVYHQEAARIHQAFYKYPDSLLDLVETKSLKSVIKSLPIKLEHALHLILGALDDILTDERIVHRRNLVSRRSLISLLDTLSKKSLINLIKSSNFLEKIIYMAKKPVIITWLHALPPARRIDFFTEAYPREIYTFDEFLVAYTSLPETDKNKLLNLVGENALTHYVLNNQLIDKKPEKKETQIKTKILVDILKFYFKKYFANTEMLVAALMAAPERVRLLAIKAAPPGTFKNNALNPILLHALIRMIPEEQRFNFINEQLDMAHVLDVCSAAEIIGIHHLLSNTDKKQFINSIPQMQLSKILNKESEGTFEFLKLYLANINEIKQNIFISYNSTEFFKKIIHITGYNDYRYTEISELLLPANKYPFLKKVLPLNPDFFGIFPKLKTLSSSERKELPTLLDEFNFQQFIFKSQEEIPFEKIPQLFDVKPSEINQALSSVPLEQRLFRPKVARITALYNILTRKYIVKPDPYLWLKYLIAATLLTAITIGAGIAAGLTLITAICLMVTLTAALSVAIKLSHYTKTKSPQIKEAEAENQIVQTLSTTSSLTLTLLSRDNINAKESQQTPERPLRTTKYFNVGNRSIFSRKPAPKVVLNNDGKLAWNGETRIKGMQLK